MSGSAALAPFSPDDRQQTGSGHLPFNVEIHRCIAKRSIRVKLPCYVFVTGKNHLALIRPKSLRLFVLIFFFGSYTNSSLDVLR